MGESNGEERVILSYDSQVTFRSPLKGVRAGTKAETVEKRPYWAALHILLCSLAYTTQDV